MRGGGEGRGRGAGNIQAIAGQGYVLKPKVRTGLCAEAEGVNMFTVTELGSLENTDN